MGSFGSRVVGVFGVSTLFAFYHLFNLRGPITKLDTEGMKTYIRGTIFFETFLVSKLQV